MSVRKATTAGRSATGRPRSGCRDGGEVVLGPLLPQQVPSAPGPQPVAEPSRSRRQQSSGGTGGGSGADRQVSAEPGSRVCVSVIARSETLGSPVARVSVVGIAPGSIGVVEGCDRRPAGSRRCARTSSSWRPASTTRPSCRNATWSAWCSSSGETVVMIVVRPRRCSASRRAISASVWASTAEVGSTSTRISGSAASARASTTRCRWPPDRPRPRSSIRPCQPPGRASNTSSAAAVTHGLLGLLPGQPTVRVDRGLQGAGEHRAGGVADQDPLADARRSATSARSTEPIRTPQRRSARSASRSELRSRSLTCRVRAARRAARPGQPFSTSRLTGS